MAMKMLEAGGVPLVTDGLRTADEDNPKGYYEDERVMNLADTADKSWLRSARGKGVKIISRLLRDLPPDNNYKVLLIRRNLSEVLASQAKMLERRQKSSETDDARMRELFEADLWRAKYLLRHGPQFQWMELEHRDFLNEPEGQARRMRDFLALDLDIEKMAAVVDRSLYRNRAEKLASG
jgi:hypothetical protein